MGAKTQAENKKLAVPGAGAYEINSKVGTLGLIGSMSNYCETCLDH